MLYILPPPRAPNPPSPWDSILCNTNGGNGGGINNNHNNNQNNQWNNRRIPRAKLRDFIFNDGSSGTQDDNMDTNRSSKSLSECYFAGKGTALVLPAADAQKSTRRSDDHNNSNGNGTNGSSSNIQKHLQSMFYLLRPEETLKMAVKLESVHPSRTRYLVVVSRMGARAEESCLLGIDCNEKTTVGLVLRVMADTTIRLDGDGGFSVSVCGRYHIFKPVSVQAMWSALQTLHKVSSKAREENYYQTGITHSWVNYYEDRIESDRSCLNEWYAMDNLESKRPPSPDSVRTKPREREETERVIRTTLKEIMMSVDLDEVTSKYIRNRLEEDLDMDLGEYKSFIDQEMLTILGQMDAPTEIFDHVYLGSEWNASNYEELQRNGVGHILNVTREIDNFFPGTFDYLNVRVYDDEKTDLLKHWDDTFKYITKAKMNGSKVLVHCKMGVSRSASVVIAYAMKAYNWDFQKAMSHVKEKRNCIKPNTNFLSQLETYQGMLAAMKNKEKLQRSKSDTNLKEDDNNNNNNNHNNNNNITSDNNIKNKNKKILVGSEPTPVIQALNKNQLQTTLSGQDLRNLNNSRPKSWSPDNQNQQQQQLKQQQIDCNSDSQSKNDDRSSIFLSLEDLSQKSTKESPQNQARNILMPCDNGENYSVSPNQIVHLHAQTALLSSTTTTTVKERINELELKENESTPPIIRAVVLKKETWDPGDEIDDNTNSNIIINNTCDDINVNNDDGSNNSNIIMESRTVWTSSTVVKNLPETTSTTNSIIINDKVPESIASKPVTTTTTTIRSDPFSNQLDRVFDREEKKQYRNSTIIEQQSQQFDNNNRDCPSRQNSWSSYDSAVVLCSNHDISSNNGLSRHSSWGSGDTRILPSRNSSWGSYDIRHCNSNSSNNNYNNDINNSTSGIFQYDKEDIPWQSGTVKRTKQKLEENNIGITKSSEDLYEQQQQQKRTSAITININPVTVSTITTPITTSRLSVSAPETSTMDLILTKDCSLSRSTSNISTFDNEPTINTSQCSNVKQHRTFLENLRNNKDGIKLTIDNNNVNKRTSSGIVSNLKKEFEAKTNVEQPQQQQFEEVVKQIKNKGNSMPSSPVSLHQSKENNLKTTSTTTSDDLINFKNLVGLFENNKTTTNDEVCRRSIKPTLTKNLRYSCIEPVERDSTTVTTNSNSNNKKNNLEYNKRPPISPNLVVRNPITPVITTTSTVITTTTATTTPTSNFVAATVIAKAVKKQQQFGKSHPLARLNIKPRHNNPVYNTM